jgi:class 3 adenylate cyclase/tetratricopeptide (TPR) repeat protein
VRRFLQTTVDDKGTESEFGLLGGERKSVSVLFCDLVGSTELSEQLDPESLRTVLTRYFDHSSAVLERHGGTVEKFIGDAVMAVFGIPTLHEDDPMRAVRAAGELIEEVDALSDELERAWGVRLRVRIGVNTGQVVAGDPRAGQTLVSGREVNVAARLEQAAAPGEVLVGERTAVAASALFEFSEPARIEAKGTAEGVVCRRLLGTARGLQVLGSTFVGREDEVASLADAYRRVVDGQRPLLVTVLGHAGVGKTRVVSELWHLLRQESPPPALHTGRCLAYGRAVTYWALGEILRELLGLPESDPPKDVLRALGPREILGLTLGLEVSGDLHPLAARQRLHRVWVELASELVAERPAVLLIEDLHWAEDPLLELLAQLLREVSGPLLLIATARPELRDRHWAVDTEMLELEPLSAGDTAQLAGELLGGDLPAGLRDVVLGRAEGNPFFVEELISSLIDQGILVRGERGWIPHDLPAGFAVPDSVQSVLAGRIDLLRPLDKAGLQAASVIGRTFWPTPVRELLDGADPDFSALEEREFVHRLLASSLEGDLEFAFKHELTREVAYGSLLKARRARLHAAFADWLERVGEGRDDWAPLIGHHYAESVRPEDVAVAWPGESEAVERLAEKAVTWLRRAAELAIGRYAIDEALAVLHRALELERDERAQAGLWHAIGRGNAMKYDGVAFWEAMQRALELTDHDAMRAEIYSELGFESTHRGTMWNRLPDPASIGEWIDQALALAAPGSRVLARALIAKGSAEDDSEALDRGLEIAQALDDVELVSYAFAARSLMAFVDGDYAGGVDWGERRLGMMDRFTDPDHRANIEFFATVPYLGAGRLEDARAHARRHEEIALTLNTHQAVHALGLWLIVEEATGNWPEIRALTPRVEQAVGANVGTPCSVNPISLLICAIAHAYLGDAKEARRLEEAAVALGMEGYGAMVDGLHGRLALIRGDLPTVERLLDDSGTWASWFFGHLSSLAVRLDGFVALGRREEVEEEASRRARSGTYLEPFALRALGQVRGDKSLIDRAAARFEAMGLAWHAGQTRAWRSLRR